MIGIFAILVQFKIVNDSAKMSFIKKIKLDPFQLLMDELQYVVTEWLYVSMYSKILVLKFMIKNHNKNMEST